MLPYPKSTTESTTQGTGLGLNLSYDIIKADRGELNVESKEGAGVYNKFKHLTYLHEFTIQAIPEISPKCISLCNTFYQYLLECTTQFE